MLLRSLMLAATLPMMSAASLPAPPEGNPQIDFAGFVKVAAEVRPLRAQRMLTFAQFKARAAEPGVLLLDARSERQFAAGHIEGAVNLPLPEFSDEALAEIVGPDRNRPILLYCNNNFGNDRPPVMLKSGRVALNPQTFTNLVAYGYPNVWELRDVLDIDDPSIGWVTG